MTASSPQDPAPGREGRAPTQRERDAEKRAAKLREIDEAVDTGRLVIRSMTPEERKRFPPRERQSPRDSRRRSG